MTPARLIGPGRRSISGLAAVLLLTVSCKRPPPATDPVRPEPSAPPVSLATSAPSAPPSGLATSAPSTPGAGRRAPPPVDPACAARRPYLDANDPEARLALPPPFAAHSACDVLAAIYPDHDRVTERSTTAHGVVRADQALTRRWQGHEGLVVTFYEGSDAEETMLCGMCRAAAHVAWLTVEGGSLRLVARTRGTIAHGGYSTSSLTVAKDTLAIAPDQELLLLDASLSGGTSPGRYIQHGLRQEGSTLRAVLEWRSGSRGMGPPPTYATLDVHAAVTARARPGHPADLLFTWGKATCEFDDQAVEICQKPVAFGTETLRFDGHVYKRVGAAVRVPFIDD